MVVANKNDRGAGDIPGAFDSQRAPGPGTCPAK